MPYIDVNIQPKVSPRQAESLASGITDAMENIMRKKRAVTAVRVESQDGNWWIGGDAVAQPTAYVDIKITAGTNSEADKAELLRHLHDLFNQTLGDLAEASYFVIDELPADAWGYAGISQKERFA